VVITAGPVNARQAEFSARVEQDLPRVYNYLRRLVRSPQTAEDLAQEAFLKAWSAYDRYDAGRPFLPWVLQIARRLALDAWRRRRELPFPEGLDPADRGRPNPEQQAAAGETAQRLEAALGGLPEAQRTAVFLYYMEGMHLEELAVVLKTSPNAVSALLLRARRRLKTLLSEP
jgi:RNA polymerase sigma factor (sigma-70 family)